MNTELKIVFVLAVLGVFMTVGAFVYTTYEMLKEHKEIEDCRNMPINEFFQNNECQKYFEAIKNE